MNDSVLVELIRNNLITRRVIDAFFMVIIENTQ